MSSDKPSIVSAVSPDGKLFAGAYQEAENSQEKIGPPMGAHRLSCSNFRQHTLWHIPSSSVPTMRGLFFTSRLGIASRTPAGHPRRDRIQTMARARRISLPLQRKLNRQIMRSKVNFRQLRMRSERRKTSIGRSGGMCCKWGEETGYWALSGCMVQAVFSPR